MPATIGREGNYVIGTTKYFTIVAVEGTLERTLDKLLAPSRQMDVGHAKLADIREFLACWQYDPATDITFARRPDAVSSIFVLTQDSPWALTRAKQLVSEVDLRTVLPSTGLVHSVDEMGLLEVANALQSEEIARMSPIPQKKAWIMTHYMNFLENYKGVPADEALKHACDRYGIDAKLFGR